MDHYRAWLALNLLPDLGRRRINKLVAHFASAEAVLDASEAELLEAPGGGPLTTRSILNWRQLADVDAEMRLIERHGVSLVSMLDPHYPVHLKRMAVPPPLIYYRGDLSPMDETGIAVIGARKMSRYGREVTQNIVTELAQAGVTIVSGLALGVDGAAHQYALEAGGRTLAVFGRGLSDVYPAKHRRLAEQILESGALISEMPMDAAPDAGSFPKRNEIIAGLSLGVLVIEAGPRSGTSITVGYALEENRSVYAVPGDVTRINSVGANKLIRDGARLVTRARDILEDLHGELGHLLQHLPSIADPEEGEIPALPGDLSEKERHILEALELDPLGVDALSDILAKSVEIAQGELMAALLNLEIRGLVRQERGMRFRRAR